MTDKREKSAGKECARLALRGVAILLLAGLLGATLVRWAPGFGMPEQILNPQLSAQSIAALEQAHAGERNPLAFYIRYLSGLVHGDAGQSTVFGQPVAALLRQRAPATLGAILAGLALGWGLALLFAAAGCLGRNAGVAGVQMAFSGALLSLPSAVLATVCILLRLPPAAAIAAVVFPRVFPHAYEQLRAAWAQPHVVMARARGLSDARLFWFHVAPAALMPILALAGISVTLACGAAIPVEALADSPGIGQLAWQAALGRDFPVLVSITLLLTAVTVLANLAAEMASMRVRRAAI